MTDDHIKLVLWRPEGQTCRWISVLRSTADYYGWTEEFEVWTPKVIRTEGGYMFTQMPNRRGRGIAEGGTRLRISRSKSRMGNPAGLTNQFKVSNSCRTIDLAELAHFTKGDWHWMETLDGSRFKREHWEEIYQAGTARRNGGLVSV